MLVEIAAIFASRFPLTVILLHPMISHSLLCGRSAILIAALAVIFVACPTHAALWHVKANAPSGGDGTSKSTAWQSLAAINQSNLLPSDHVLVYSGTYDERLTIAKSGASASSRIIYQAIDDGGGRPVIRGVTGGTHDYIAIIGFEIVQVGNATNSPGVHLSGCDGWLVQDNYIHNTSGGGVIGHYNTNNGYNIIRSNVFEEVTSPLGVPAEAAGYWTAANIQMYGHHNLIEYNTIYGGLDRVTAFGGANVVRNNLFGPTNSLDYPGSIGVGSVTVTQKGSGYTSPPNVTIGSPAHGAAATGVAVLGTGADADKVVAVNVGYQNRGWGYTTVPTVTFSGGGGSGAEALARLDPYHIDTFQSGSPESGTSYPLTQFMFERNWDEDNFDPVGATNGHGLLIQNYADNDLLQWAVLRFNVLIRPAGVSYSFMNFHRVRGYNNTSIGVQSGSASQWQAAVSYAPPPFGRLPDDHAWWNNTWSNSPKTMGGIFTTQNAPTNFSSGYQHRYDAGALPAGSANNVGSGASVDPKFIDAGNDDYRLAVDSPLRNAAGSVTFAVGNGVNSTTLTVTNADRLFDGWGIADGDILKIGSADLVRVVSIDYDTQVVTLAAPRTWSDAAEVSVKGSDDIGALPYGLAEDFEIQNTTPLTTTVVGIMELTATVNHEDAVRMVEFLVDGLPVGLDYDAPYSVAWQSDGLLHHVEARAYNAWASRTLYKGKLNTAPRFTQQPASQNAAAGGNVTLTAVASAPESPTYQWYKDGVPITGATGNSIHISYVSSTDAGLYWVVATNSLGSEKSDEATMAVVAPPFVTGASGLRANNENGRVGEFGVGTSTRNDLLRDSAYIHATTTTGVTVAASGSGAIHFATGGVSEAHERMTITADGDVGIGISVPNARLEVFGVEPSEPVRFHLTNGGGASGTGELRIGSFSDSAGFHVTSNANPQHSATPSNSYQSDHMDRTSFEMLNVNGESLAGAESYLDLRWGESGTFVTTARFQGDGKVGIGTGDDALTDMLTVGGNVRANSFIAPGGTWADHVFAEEYDLTPLSEIEQFTRTHGHLPGVPSAREVAENGIDMVAVQVRLLEKIEELTLHLIEQEKLLQQQSERLRALEQRSEVRE